MQNLTSATARVAVDSARHEDGILLTGLNFSYGAVPILSDLNLSIRKGEFFSLLGYSGSGKTTTLKLVAGLLAPSAGTIAIGGTEMTKVPTHRRSLGMVFQSYALFPHMTLVDNVAFPLKMKKDGDSTLRRKKALDALELVGLRGVGSRFPRELSGGQQQRVGLARAIVAEPDVLLLDEPLSNLDAKLREQMSIEISQLQKRLGLTVLYITHDQGEALSMSDRIAIMAKGQVKEIGPPAELYERPRTLEAATFLGDTNLFPATSQVADQSRRHESQKPVHDNVLSVRPEVISIGPSDAVTEAGKIHLTGEISAVVYKGERTMVTVDVVGCEAPILISLSSRLTRQSEFRAGETVSVSWSAADGHYVKA